MVHDGLVVDRNGLNKLLKICRKKATLQSGSKSLYSLCGSQNSFKLFHGGIVFDVEVHNSCAFL